ncbi:MAG: hypothetical protein GXP04_01715 [Alphaproteobacteria bacterium]|nr:hypothetical protein [Alphaproteobacteria bacterium]
MNPKLLFLGTTICFVIIILYFFWSGDLCIPTKNENSCVVDWGVFGNTLSGIAIGATALAAFWGLNTWQTKQRASLAMEILTLVHEGVSQLRYSLSPQGFTASGKAKKVDFNDRKAVKKYWLKQHFRSALHFRESELDARFFWTRVEAKASHVRTIFSEFDAHPLERLLEIRFELLDLAYLVKAYEDQPNRGEIEDFSICGDGNGTQDALQKAMSLFPCEIRSDVFSRSYFGETEIAGGSLSDEYMDLKRELEGLITLARYTAFRIYEKKWSYNNNYQGPG